MSDEEIKKALEIIKNKAINIEIVNDIVDKKEYIGFDKDYINRIENTKIIRQLERIKNENN